MIFTDKASGDKLISIVIPLYNKESSIRRTLQSVFAQTYRHFEIIIVDDGSTDNSLAVIESFDDSRIRLFKQTNAGVSSARNNGIKYSKGDYIAFLDADDEWDIDYLERQIELIGHFPGCALFSINYRFRYSDGIIEPTIINGLRFQTATGEMDNYFAVASESNCPIWTSSVVIRKNALLSIGGFPIGVTSGEDLLTWAKLAVGYRICFDKRSGATYNIPFAFKCRNAIGRPHDKIDTVGQELEKLFARHKKIPGLKKYVSFWYKMRASVSLRRGNIDTARNECVKSLGYDMLNLKTMVIFIISLLPRKFQSLIFNR